VDLALQGQTEIQQPTLLEQPSPQRNAVGHGVGGSGSGASTLSTRRRFEKPGSQCQARMARHVRKAEHGVARRADNGVHGLEKRMRGRQEIAPDALRLNVFNSGDEPPGTQRYGPTAAALLNEFAIPSRKQQFVKGCSPFGIHDGPSELIYRL